MKAQTDVVTPQTISEENLKDDDALSVWVSELTFSDGTKISINKDDIIVFVGPNNSGKSASLKETVALLENKSRKGKTVKDISIITEGSTELLFKFLDSESQIKRQPNGSAIDYEGYLFRVQRNAVGYYWTNYKKGIGSLCNLFLMLITTGQRLAAANPPQNIKLRTEAPTHPIHFLQKRDDLEKRFCDYFKQAFGLDLIVHRNAGAEVPLYVGKAPLLKDGEDRVSGRYLEELEKLDLLHEQGDGMRSFVGVLLSAFVSKNSMLFIDEPEAFLHPPQARLLGKMLAKDLPSKRQLYLATHSGDFLKGLLDANIDNLKIIRIQRDGSVNKVCSLGSSDVQKIWSDSLLRHSNVLDGLFHSKVIICESDSDCRFFSAILSSAYEDSDSVIPDILFIHCGGKHRMPVVIKALKTLNVPLAVVCDFDVLNDENPLRRICENLGGLWTEIEKDWRMVKKAIEQKRPELLTDNLREEITGIFSSTAERIFPAEKVTAIQKALKKVSAWSEAKSAGKRFVPAGDATRAFDRIHKILESKGMFVLEVGELEGFVRSVGNHGPKWIAQVLSEKNLKADPELQDARDFVNKLL